MKKITLLILLAITTSSINSIAQDNEDFRSKVQFGLKLGGNYSNVYDSKGEQFDAEPKFGLAAGLFLAIPITEEIGLHPEVLFSQKGFKGSGMILGSSYEFTRTTNFIDVPLYIAFKPSSFLTLLAGPQYSYLIKQRDVFANATTSIAQEQEFMNDNVRKNILGLSLGADINLTHFVPGVRLGWDMLNNNGDGTSSTPRYKNIWFQATLGYRFYGE